MLMLSLIWFLTKCIKSHPQVSDQLVKQSQYICNQIQLVLNIRSGFQIWHCISLFNLDALDVSVRWHRKFLWLILFIHQDMERFTILRIILLQTIRKFKFSHWDKIWTHHRPTFGPRSVGFAAITPPRTEGAERTAECRAPTERRELRGLGRSHPAPFTESTTGYDGLKSEKSEKQFDLQLLKKRE